MTALTSDRNTPTAIGDARQGSVAAGQKIFAGALVMRNATGYLVKGATALNLIGVGRSDDQVDNTTGADGDLSLAFRPVFFRFANDGTDTVTIEWTAQARELISAKALNMPAPRSRTHWRVVTSRLR